MLARAVTAERGKEPGELLRKAVGADHDTGTVTQPYRVAGTPNFPKTTKRERVAGPTRILEHNGKLWTPDELREALEAIKPARKEEGKRSRASVARAGVQERSRMRRARATGRPAQLDR